MRHAFQTLPHVFVVPFIVKAKSDSVRFPCHTMEAEIPINLQARCIRVHHKPASRGIDIVVDGAHLSGFNFDPSVVKTAPE